MDRYFVVTGEKRILRYTYTVMKHLWLFPLCWLMGCQAPTTGQEESNTQEPPGTPIAKIDIHAHYRADRDYLVELLDSFNLKPLLVDVARQDSSIWMENLSGLKQVYQKYPQYFYCASFGAAGIDQPGFADNVISRLQEEIDQGARMVKVWKNFGMIFKDQSGAYVHIDDERLQPIWDFLVEKNIPVLSHIGEPLQAWRPLEDDNPHANYYRNHPEYHAYHHPEIPSWDTIQQARNNWLARNPQLMVVGAHNGSMSHDVDLMAQRLDEFPNFYVEPAARFGDLARQEADKVRAFLIKYQDRFLYGTDLGTSTPQSEMDPVEFLRERQGIVYMMDMHWRYLSGKGPLDFHRSLQGNSYPTRGLELPDSVLSKIYYKNAAKLLKL